MAEKVVLIEVKNDGTHVFKIEYDPPEDNPNFGEKGEAVDIPNDASLEHINSLIDGRHEDAKNNLPPGSVYDIRSKWDHTGVAWYHVDAMDKWPTTGPIPWPGLENDPGGYYILGTFRTPGSPRT